MTLPARARVEAAPRFFGCLREVEAFWVEQDEASAPDRLRQLRSALRTMIDVLAWVPASGRPARFAASRSDPAAAC